MIIFKSNAAFMVDELGDRKAVTDKPACLGGIPYDDLMIMAYGIVESVDVACRFTGIALKGSKVVIQGFGRNRFDAAGRI